MAGLPAGLPLNHPRGFFSSLPTVMESSLPIVSMVGRGEKVLHAAIVLEIRKLGKHIDDLEHENAELKKMVQGLKMEVQKVYKKNKKDLDGMKVQLALAVMARDDGSNVEEESEHKLDLATEAKLELSTAYTNSNVFKLSVRQWNRM
jgi:hypothetical protein